MQNELDPDRMPKHVAIIMDGNGRWAKKRLLNRINGHEKGADAVRVIVRTARKLNISALTLYAFSTENWQRPQPEISGLMLLLRRFLQAERQTMIDNNIRLNIESGDFITVIGSNGAGKSTLVKALTGIDPDRLAVDGSTALDAVGSLMPKDCRRRTPLESFTEI